MNESLTFLVFQVILINCGKAEMVCLTPLEIRSKKTN
jgi:hypothetical protein